MSRLLGMVSLVVILLGGCDRVWVSDPWSNRPTAEDSDAVWANPPNCAPDAPGVSLPVAQKDLLPGVGLMHATYDAEFYNVALHVPGGWGGFYMQPVNGRNTPVLLLVDTTNILAALDTLKRFYPDRAFRRDSVVLRVVRWDWIQLYDWYRYFNRVGLPRWTRSDIDEVENRLAYGAASQTARQALLQRLSDLGAPCWLAAVAIHPGGVFKDAQAPR